MVDIFLILVITAASWGTGDLILGRIGVPAGWAFSTGLGLGALSLLTLFVGLTGNLYPGVLALILVIFLIPSLSGLWQIRTPFKGLGLQAKNMLKSRVDIIISILILGVLSVGIFSALAPPVEPDALSYHLLRPKYFLERHRIDFVTGNIFFQFPGFMEILFTLGIGLSSDRLAQLIHLLMMLMGLVGIYGYARDKGGIRLALFSALLFLAIPMVNYNASAGLVDVGLASYEILAFIALLLWIERRETGFLAIAGAMSGFALGIKYTALFALLLNIIIILAVSLKRRRGLLLSMILYLSPALILPSFWYIKNLVKFSNPIHPLFPGLFSMLGLNPAFEPSYEGMKAYLSSFGVERSLKNLLILPWIITMPNYRIPLESGAMPFVPLAILPGLLFLKRLPSWVKCILAYCGAYLVLWFFFGTQQGRFIITPMALLCLPTAFCAISLMKMGRLVKFSAILAVVLSVAMCSGILAYKRGKSALTGAGIISAQEYLEKSFGAFQAIQYIKNNLPQAKVFVFFEPRLEYYLGKKYLACDSENPAPTCRQDLSALGPEEVKRKLIGLGTTHLLVNKEEIRFYKGSQWETPALKKQITLIEKLISLSKEVFSANGVSLYEL